MQLIILKFKIVIKSILLTFIKYFKGKYNKNKL